VESRRSEIALLQDGEHTAVCWAAPGETGLTQGEFAFEKSADRGKSPAVTPRGWCLVWFGSSLPLYEVRIPRYTHGGMWRLGNYDNDFKQVDCPLLLVFRSPGPAATISPGERGALLLHFGVDGAAVAVVPIFGMKFPLAAETLAWKEKLPDAVRQRCEWWAAHVRRLPAACAETYASQADGTRITVTDRFTFRDWGREGTAFSPLPPMLAVAKLEGFPVELSGELCDTGCMTRWGPYCGIDGVTESAWTLKGMKRYVQERSTPGTVAAPGRLQAELDRQVRKVIAAGHLAPMALSLSGYYHGGEAVYWSQPGDTLRFLTERPPSPGNRRQMTCGRSPRWMSTQPN